MTSPNTMNNRASRLRDRGLGARRVQEDRDASLAKPRCRDQPRWPHIPQCSSASRNHSQRTRLDV